MLIMDATPLLALFAALAVVVAGVTVLVEMLRHRRRAEARMSASAFLLRRQLESWLTDHDWPEGNDDTKREELAAVLIKHFGPSEVRATSLLEESGDARKHKARQAKYSAALFFEATGRVNVFAHEAEKPEHRKAIETSPDPHFVILSVATRADVGKKLRREFDEVPLLIRQCNAALGIVIDKDLDLDAALARARKDEKAGEVSEEK